MSLRGCAVACAIAGSFVGGPFAGGASAAETRTTLPLFVPFLSELSITGDVSGLLTLTQDGSGEGEYDTGYVESAADATVLTINTNDSWDLSAKLNGEWTDPGSYDKNEDDLLIRITNKPVGTIQNGADAYTTLSTTDLGILSHGTAVTGNEVEMQARVMLDWEKDVPGDYAITVVYTLAVHLP